MNILMISHYAGGKEYGMEYRSYYLSREWVKQGHHVTVVAATYSHLRLKNPNVIEDYSDEIIDGIHYIWIKTPEYGGALARIKNMVTFVRKLSKYKDRLILESKPELVIATSVYLLDIYPARKIAQKTRAKLCYECHDIWPLSPQIIGGYSKWHPFIMVMQKAEDDTYKFVDKVVSLLWNSEEHMRERGLAPGKFVCIPNGYNPDEWSDDKFELTLPEGHQKVFDGLKRKTIVGFAGGFAASGSIDILVKAAVLFKDDPNLHVVLVGKGPEQSTYEHIIKDNGLTNVTILPPVPKSLIPAIDSHFDICYLGGVHSPLHKYGTSANKMTDYMLCGKPIVYAIDEPGAAVEREGCGIRIEAENVKEVANAIQILCKMSSEERIEMGNRGRWYAQNLKWSILAQKFIDAFNN